MNFQQQRPQQQNTTHVNGVAPDDFRCFLCNKPGHRFSECFTYRNEKPKPVGQECNQCHGRHASECRTKINGARGGAGSSTT